MQLTDGENLSVLEGRLEVASAPDLPFDPKQPVSYHVTMNGVIHAKATEKVLSSRIFLAGKIDKTDPCPARDANSGAPTA